MAVINLKHLSIKTSSAWVSFVMFISNTMGDQSSRKFECNMKVQASRVIQGASFEFSVEVQTPKVEICI
jgi:hypothetical protein